MVDGVTGRWDFRFPRVGVYCIEIYPGNTGLEIRFLSLAFSAPVGTRLDARYLRWAWLGTGRCGWFTGFGTCLGVSVTATVSFEFTIFPSLPLLAFC